MGAGAAGPDTTYGFLIGEVVRRVSGLPPGGVPGQEVTGPLGIDFTIGPPERRRGGRPSWCIRGWSPTASRPRSSPSWRRGAWVALTNPPISATEANTAAWRAAEIPAANGRGTARAVAAPL